MAVGARMLNILTNCALSCIYVTNQNNRRHWVVVEVVSLQCEEFGMAPYPMARGVTCRTEAYHIIVNSGALTTPVYVPAFYLKSSFLRPYFSRI